MTQLSVRPIDELMEHSLLFLNLIMALFNGIICSVGSGRPRRIAKTLLGQENLGVRKGLWIEEEIKKLPQ